MTRVAQEKISTRNPTDQLQCAFGCLAQPYAEDKLTGILFLELYLVDTLDRQVILQNAEEIFSKNAIYDRNISDRLCVKVFKKLIMKHGIPCAKKIASRHTVPNLRQARSSLVSFTQLTHTDAYIPLILTSCKTLITRQERFAKTAVGRMLRELSKTKQPLVKTFISSYYSFFSSESLQNATKYRSEEESKMIKKETSPEKKNMK
jgi:3-methyladenine DNA glycosylase AlkD